MIDEISMLSGDVLQMLDYVCRSVRDARHEPFGGLQVILVGDFFQLPPVSFKQWRFAFEAPAWAALIRDLLSDRATPHRRPRASKAVKAPRGRMQPIPSRASLAPCPAQ